MIMVYMKIQLARLVGTNTVRKYTLSYLIFRSTFLSDAKWIWSGNRTAMVAWCRGYANIAGKK